MTRRSLKSGFSLAEVLIAVALIGILAAILVPSLNKFKPNKHKAMFKKAYQEISRISYELVNDNELYPDGDGVVGFDNVAAVSYNGATYGDGNNPTNPASTAAKCKFTNLFATKLNTVGNNVNCADAHGSFASFRDGSIIGTPSFVTTDGIAWALPRTNFTDLSRPNDVAIKPIVIDVNGLDKQPNVFDSVGSSACRNNVDRFLFGIRADGRVIPLGGCAQAYAKDLGLVTTKEYSGSIMAIQVFSEDGTGHIAASSSGDDSGDDYFDGDVGNCDPTLINSDPRGSGCFQ